MQDDVWMKKVIALADHPTRSLLPNPRVGAIIVQNGKILGEGFHEGPGKPHAEVKAIRNAEGRGIKNFRKATLYTNLEPCCHTDKKTPPCVPLLIQKKFKRVIVGSLDPNPEVSGKGIRQLKAAGISVKLQISEESISLNQAFFKNQMKKLPYITLKMATTFDGKWADDYGKSKWITGAEARQEVHKLRKKVNAIAVGRGTMDKDDPELNVRLPNRSPSSQKIIIFGKPKKKLHFLRAAKANGLKNILILPDRKKNLLRHLRSLYREHQIYHLLVEGGPGLASSFLKEGLVDEVILYMGKGFLGGAGTYSLLKTGGLKRLSKSTKFLPAKTLLVGQDIKIQGFLHVYRPH